MASAAVRDDSYGDDGGASDDDDGTEAGGRAVVPVTAVAAEDLVGGTPEAVVYATAAYLIRGADLRVMRERVGLTVRDLAARIDYSFSQVAAWERGICRVPREQWPRILRELQAEWRAQEEWRTFLGSLHLPTPPLKRPGDGA